MLGRLLNGSLCAFIDQVPFASPKDRHGQGGASMPMLCLKVPNVLVGYIEFGIELGDKMESITTADECEMHDQVKSGDARGQSDQEAFEAVHGSGSWVERLGFAKGISRAVCKRKYTNSKVQVEGSFYSPAVQDPKRNPLNLIVFGNLKLRGRGFDDLRFVDVDFRLNFRGFVGVYRVKLSLEIVDIPFQLSVGSTEVLGYIR